MKTIVNIIITAFAVIITSYVLPGVKVESFFTALVVAIVLSLINSFVKPILVILTIPVTYYTYGLFLLVINAGMVMLTSHIVKGFDVKGFWWALAFSIILSLVRSLLESFDRKDQQRDEQ